VKQFSLILLILLILAGCAARPLQVVAPCPEPNLPEEPHYPVADLKQGDSHATVAKAYVATDRLKSDYISELKHIYGGYL
jgi:uncharacterized protein YcfL